MAMPTEKQLPAFLRGDSYAIPIAFEGDDGQLQDLTGWTLIFTLKFHRMQPDDDAVLQKRMTVSGTTAVIYLAPEDTNELTPYRYEYDLQLITPDGSAVSTIAIGKVEIQSGVTHALG
ncbi:hypothetical protein [Salinisphaera sp. G21_0]|uniref:hypothetical protein n=1 Tax=Salinisphaera sp. G21_0 TaxID=2821094 RepID=UPI001ADD016D|nr:hypothetical protein [Salinisphaera sp. G21_0]MBO9484025.1 hypothetical protein [Salinisphaera sp. G21_0]